MTRIFILCCLCVARTPRAATADEIGGRVAADAMGILRDNCVSCHNAEKHKGGLMLMSQKGLADGGEHGPVFFKDNLDKSPLILNLDANAESHMPPKKQLSSAEIASLKKWISAGAHWDQAAFALKPATRKVVMHPLPADYHPVLCLALSPDQHWLAAGRGNHIDIFDVSKAAAKLNRLLDGVQDAAQSLAWSHDGKWLAAGDYRRVLAWQIDTESPPVELKGFSSRVTAMCFLPDGKLLAADGGASSPGALRVCDVTSSEVGSPVIVHSDEILALSLSPDGKMFATASADKTVKLFSVDSLKELVKLEGHTNHVTALAFSEDGSQLATGGTDRDVKIWDTKTHEQLSNHGPHAAAVTAVAWIAGDSKRLAVGCESNAIYLENTEESAVGRPLSSADDVLYSIAVRGKGDARVIFAGCHDGQVYQWGANGSMKRLGQ